MLQMLIGPVVGPVDENQVAAAYPWPDRGAWVRALMVTTLDGAAAGPDGRSGSISSGADRAVFAAVRRSADVVLVGAGTMRAERYRPMRANPADAAARAVAGQAAAPVVAVVSASLDLPWEEPIWSGSAVTPIILTGHSADPAALEVARAHADVLVLDDLGAGSLVAALISRGLRRIVCEGGPTLLASFAAAGLLDEADITLAPLFAGGGQTPHTPALTHPLGLRLVHVIAGEGFLMNRYVAEDRS